MDEVAGAIADPVRREILAMLRERRMSAGQIADRFAISRPAVSRHLRVLRASGLVHDELTGRRRFYRLDPAPLARLAEWLTPFVADHPASAAWSRRFDALETEVYRTRRDRRRTPAGEPPAGTGRGPATKSVRPSTKDGGEERSA
ncbi:metalloregulator ArsR/SmtB family transcription factor [Phytohabitans sp. ZYX-F-186]|uniref:Metalloregulator ArsR/SmtB family transcription factor n=1 Tax=Phytohabitans maris TaxID=3071409 RepID=A0ABU0ZMD1_9ACTN|nr:metalloregulator ArsR/SmtB family transcription factor [Phytohabitans sp. ZYX-F-186]MDQ7908190.1 metalloregulator ArsR/SmtB family transcription factor [Phytohabitans sp. ZYX-F-186]